VIEEQPDTNRHRLADGHADNVDNQDAHLSPLF
jgi:hypothetical protein